MTRENSVALRVAGALLAFGYTAGSLGAQTVPSAAAPGKGTPAEAQAQFDIWEYRVIGNTTLARASVERAVYPFLGSGKTIADVEAARVSLERAYRDAGYGTVFVDTPEQQVEGGIVRLRVTEGRLDRVRVSGARYFSNGAIRGALPALAQGEVPHVPELQSELTALNRVSADRSVVPVLKAGRAPGTVDVDLKVSDKLPLHGSVEVNDRYTAGTTRTRINASLSYDNLFQKLHSIALQYQTSPEDSGNVEAMVGSYSFRLPAWRNTTFSVYAVDSKSDVAALGTLAVIGKGQIYGLRVNQSLPAGKRLFHGVSFGLDYKNFLEDIRLDQDTGLLTPIHYLGWSAMYAGTRVGDHSTLDFNLAANFGLRRIFNRSAEFQDKRFRGAPNYFYLRGGGQYLRPLPLNLQLFVRLAGQFTQSPLVSNEQFAVGGADTVRGYLEANQLGDYGFDGSVELRGGWLAKPLGLAPGRAYVFAFYDAGIAASLDPLPGQQAQEDLASWGIGLRVLDWHGFDLMFDWAHAFTNAGTVHPSDERTDFLFRYSW